MVVSALMFGQFGTGDVVAQEIPPVTLAPHIPTPTDAQFEAALNEDGNGSGWIPVKKKMRYLPAPTPSRTKSRAEREYERRRGEVAYIEQLDLIVVPPDGIAVMGPEPTLSHEERRMVVEPCPDNMSLEDCSERIPCLPATMTSNCIVAPFFYFFREENKNPRGLFFTGDYVTLDSAGQAFISGMDSLPDGFEFLSEFPVWRIPR